MLQTSSHKISIHYLNHKPRNGKLDVSPILQICHNYCVDVTVTVARCSELKTTIASLKKKESEETQALENMVAKVEKNLVASTVRHLHYRSL